MKDLRVVFLAILSAFLFSCSNDDGDSNPTSNNGLDEPNDSTVYYSISGTVKDQEGETLTGIEVNLTGDMEDSTHTNNDGFYLFDSLEAGGKYLVFIGFDDANFNPLTSDETANFQINVYKEVTISGTIKDIDGNPVEDVPLIFFISPSAYGDTTEQSSDANGHYEFTVELHPDIFSWQIIVNSVEHRYKGASEDPEIRTSYIDRINGDYRSSDVVIDINQVDDLINDWYAEDEGVSALERDAGIVRSFLNFQDDLSTYIWTAVDTNEVSHAYAFSKKPYTITRSPDGNIHSVELVGNTANYKGIYEVTKSGETWTLKLEVVDTDAGHTPPTVEAGFGSSNNGENGSDFVWTFTKRE